MFCPHSVFMFFSGSEKQWFLPYTALTDWFLGAFKKLRIETISFVMTVRPSVHLTAWNKSASIGRIFLKFKIRFFFRKSAKKIKVSLILYNNKLYFTWRLFTIFIMSRSFVLGMENIPDKYCRESRNITLGAMTFFSLKSCNLWHNVEKYCTVGHATDNNMTHAHWVLDT